MLTRFVRAQLIIFTIASVIGLTVMVVVYLQAPTMLGIGRITVTAQLPATGGLYRFSNVTYRGVQVGKVTTIDLTDEGAKAVLSLDDSPRIPANLKADVRSISAVGEQYLDLQPVDDAPPYLRDGASITLADGELPQEIGPLLDQTSALLTSIPSDKLGNLLDESFKAFNGAGYDLQSLIDSSAKLTGDLSAVGDQTTSLVADSAPLLDGQDASAEDLRSWARHLAGLTGQAVTDDQHFRAILRDGPGTAIEATRLLEQVKPTLPILLANMTSLGQILVTYNPGLEQLLVLFPPFIANILSEAPDHNPTGLGQGDFALTEGDPPSCTVGFLPPNMWRSPEDTSLVDTPDGLYCKLPQDSPLAVRGARNYPCMNQPGKRAPTAAICNSADPFRPLAMREHMLGPYPFDPNLVAQGIPPDSRVTAPDRLTTPSAATTPPGSAQPPAPPVESPAPQPPPDDGLVIPAAPSAYSGSAETRRPAMVFAQYDPSTGRYVTADGRTRQQRELQPAGRPNTWKDLIMADPQ